MNLYEEIERSFPLIEKQFTEEDLLKFKKQPVSNLCNYHFGLGTWIRENLLNPDNTNLYNLFLELGVKGTDDMSDYIIKKFHEEVSGKK